jgi:hypothetical protein
MLTSTTSLKEPVDEGLQIRLLLKMVVEEDLDVIAFTCRYQHPGSQPFIGRADDAAYAG